MGQQKMGSQESKHFEVSHRLGSPGPYVTHAALIENLRRRTIALEFTTEPVCAPLPPREELLGVQGHGL